MRVGFRGRDSAAGGAGEEAQLDEVGFVDVFDGFSFFARCRGDGLDADGTAAEFVNQRFEDVPVGRFESEVIDFEEVKRVLGDRVGDESDVSRLREVASAFQEAIGDARGAAARFGELFGAGRIETDIQDATRTFQNASDFFFRIKFQSVNGAETISQGIRNRPQSRRRADQGELGQVELDSPRRGTLPDDDVEFVVFHCGVEDFFDEFVETMNFVDEKHVAVFEIGENRTQVADALNCRAARHFHPDTHFFGDNVGECGFAQASGTIEEDVLHRVIAFPGGIDEDTEIPLDFFLPDVFAESLRAKRRVECRIIGNGGRRGEGHKERNEK